MFGIAGVLDYESHLIRISQEEHHCAREQISGGFVSGHEQLIDDAQHLGDFERLGAFEPGVQKISCQIIARDGLSFVQPRVRSNAWHSMKLRAHSSCR